MKNEATKTNFGRPRRPYQTDGVLFMRIPKRMVAICRAIVGMLCEADLPPEVLAEVMQGVKSFIKKYKSTQP